MKTTVVITKARVRDLTVMILSLLLFIQLFNKKLNLRQLINFPLITF